MTASAAKVLAVVAPVEAVTREPAFAWRPTLDRLAALLPWRRDYEHPEGRSGHIIERLAKYCTGSIIDIGAGRNATVLTERFGDAYHPLDMGSSYHIEGRSDLIGPNTLVDLERDPLPFADRAYDTVVCTDVLEHIDNIYHSYDELFRIANRHVIVSLPNNWVLFIMSMLRGRNFTHRAGYGLPPFPKGNGERHKYWFNHEEAAEFLTGRIPAGFRVALFESRFEYGSDSLLCGIRPYALLVRTIEMGRFARYVKRDHRGARRWVVLAAGYLGYALLRPLDVALGALVWGFGPPSRFYNLFCRQVWVVFERTAADCVAD